MEEQIMVFSKEWFKKHNKILCWFANAPIIKYWFRRLICIDNSTLWSEKIEEMTPNSFTYGKKLILSGGKLKWVQKIDIGTNRFIAKELYYKLKPLWYLIHFWDYVTYSRPEFNLGFDTLTAYSEAGGGSGKDTCDGRTQRSGSAQTFANIRSGDGTWSNYTYDHLAISLRCSDSSNTFDVLNRSNCSFDTSGIPSDGTITDAVLSLYYYTKEEYLGTDVSLHVCKSTQAKANELADSDYGNYESTSFGSIDMDDFSSGYEDITLNSSGRSHISKTGVTMFGLRTSWDINNNFNGTWKQYSYGGFAAYTADYSSSTRPRLVVTYTLPVVGPAKLKTRNGLAVAKIKTINGLAIGKTKTINGLS